MIAAAARPGPPQAKQLCLDSSVVCTLLLQERGWQAILNTIQRPEIDGILPGPSLTEAIWVTRNKGNQTPPIQIRTTLDAMGLRVEHPTDDDLVRAAELIETSHDNPRPSAPRSKTDATLPLGDALILAVTERLECMVLTRDGHWKWMVDEGHLKVRVVIP